MAESAAAVAVPKGVQKLDGDSILYIKKKALTTYEKRLKKRPQKLKYIIYGIDMSNPELFVQLCYAHYYSPRNQRTQYIKTVGLIYH